MVKRKDKGSRKNKRNSLKNAVKHPGSLKDVGFSEKESLNKEEKAIKKADKKYGKAETERKLDFLAAVTKRYPKIHEKLKELIRWNR